MSRSPLILLAVLIASSLTAQAQNSRRYFDDFRGQKYCATRERSREGTCCASRIDECSVPIAGENFNLIAFTLKELKFSLFLKEPCATVTNFVTNTSIPIAVPIMKVIVKESQHQSLENVKSVITYSNLSKKQRTIAIYGSLTFEF